LAKLRAHHDNERLPRGFLTSLPLLENLIDAVVIRRAGHGGFADSAEREWFRLLTTVQGVGAKVALNILSALSPRDLIAAIRDGDRGALTRASGVGAKLAVRLLTELREKAGAMPVGVGFSPVLPPSAGIESDAISALVNLGYRRPEVAAAVAKALERAGEGASLDQLIRDGLKELAR